MKAAMVLVVLVLCGCSSAASAKDVCEKLSVAAGGKCVADKPAGLGAAAREKYELELDGDKGCQVLTFAKGADYDTVVDAFEGAKKLAGPHRYGNKSKQVFVQCSSEIDDAIGGKVKAAVDAL